MRAKWRVALRELHILASSQRVLCVRRAPGDNAAWSSGLRTAIARRHLLFCPTVFLLRAERPASNENGSICLQPADLTPKE